MTILFPFADYWWFYGAFTLFILLLLTLDLGVFHRKAREVHFKEAAIWSTIWISLGLFFSWLLYHYCLATFPTHPQIIAMQANPVTEASRISLEYLTGFVIEKSLAIDNIFVFVVVFQYFAIPLKYQHRVLFFGIIGALLFRILFIAMGAFLIAYKPVMYLFGAFLILTGFKIIFAPPAAIDPGKNFLIRFLKKRLPITDKITGQSFFVRTSKAWAATPLFLALIFIELLDIVFAIDSVPAIFAITKEPLLVYTSNIFAILGLRSMYFLLAAVVHRFTYLKYGLGIVLVFVGLKMVYLNELYGGHFPITWSLSIILVTITTSILLSLTKRGHNSRNKNQDGQIGKISRKDK